MSDWPVDVATTGTVINQIEGHLRAGDTYPGTALVITREQLKQWQDCVIYCAALLDPDNPPLSAEQLKQMRPRR